jgi:hydrogenase nickel incorporation protein HypA/HybF
MHELSLCAAIAGLVRDHAADRGVTQVVVEIGHLRQVVPDSLELCWAMVTQDSDLEGARLVIDHVPAVVGCAACSTHSSIDSPVLVCGSCGSHDVKLLSGEEFLVVSIDVLEPV